jgi:DtxR family Mn-dependent transcriptional regulator
MLTFAEENYIKSIYQLSLQEPATTSKIAAVVDAKPASVSDMLNKLSKKGIIRHEKYKGVELSESGKKLALFVIRKHRLWEVFLVEKLNFTWDQVHEVAEQLEHINSNLLIERLDEFLNFPRFDPHGDPIPDKYGNIISLPQMPACEMLTGQTAEIVSVKDSSANFLRYLDKIGLRIGSVITLLDKIEYDGSSQIAFDQNPSIFVSKEVMSNLFVAKSL